MTSLDWTKLNQQKERLEGRLSKGSGTRAKFWRPVDGNNKIRIMPGWATEGDFSGQFWREIAQHWGVSDEQKGPILCPKHTPYMQGDCPICQFVEELKADKSNVAAMEAAKDLRAKTAYLLSIIDTKDPVYTASDVADFKKARPDSDVPFNVGDFKVQVYACPSTVFNQILSTIQSNGIDITQVEGGHNISIRKTGKGLMTRYETNIEVKPTDAPDVGTLPDLSGVGYEMNFSEMLELLSSGVGAEFTKLLPARVETVGTPSETPEEEMGSVDDLRAKLAAAAK